MTKAAPINTVVPFPLLPNVKLHGDLIVTYSSVRLECWSILGSVLLMAFKTGSVVESTSFIGRLFGSSPQVPTIHAISVLNHQSSKGRDTRIVMLLSGQQYVCVMSLLESTIRVALLDDFVLDTSSSYLNVLLEGLEQRKSMRLFYAVEGGLAIAKINLDPELSVEDVKLVSLDGNSLIFANGNILVYKNNNKLAIQEGKYTTELDTTGQWTKAVFRDEDRSLLLVQGQRYEPWFDETIGFSSIAIYCNRKVEVVTIPVVHYMNEELLASFAGNAVMMYSLGGEQLGHFNVDGEILDCHRSGMYITILCVEEERSFVRKLCLRKSTKPTIDFTEMYDILQPTTPYSVPLDLPDNLIINMLIGSRLYPPGPGWSALRQLVESLSPQNILFLLFESHGPMSEASVKTAGSFARQHGINWGQFVAIQAYWFVDHRMLVDAVRNLASPFCARIPDAVWSFIMDTLYANGMYSDIVKLFDVNQRGEGGNVYDQSLLRLHRASTKTAALAEYLLQVDDFQWLPPTDAVFEALDIVFPVNPKKFTLFAMQLALRAGRPNRYEVIDEQTALFVHLTSKPAVHSKKKIDEQESIKDGMKPSETTVTPADKDAKAWSSPSIRRYINASSSPALSHLVAATSPDICSAAASPFSKIAPVVRIVKSPAAKRRSVRISPQPPQVIPIDNRHTPDSRRSSAGKWPYASKLPSRLSNVHTLSSDNLTAASSNEDLPKSSTAQLDLLTVNPTLSESTATSESIPFDLAGTVPEDPRQRHRLLKKRLFQSADSDEEDRLDDAHKADDRRLAEKPDGDEEQQHTETNGMDEEYKQQLHEEAHDLRTDVIERKPAYALKKRRKIRKKDQEVDGSVKEHRYLHEAASDSTGEPAGQQPSQSLPIRLSAHTTRPEELQGGEGRSTSPTTISPVRIEQASSPARPRTSPSNNPAASTEPTYANNGMQTSPVRLRSRSPRKQIIVDEISTTMQEVLADANAAFRSQETTHAAVKVATSSPNAAQPTKASRKEPSAEASPARILKADIQSPSKNARPSANSLISPKQQKLSSIARIASNSTKPAVPAVIIERRHGAIVVSDAANSAASLKSGKGASRFQVNAIRHSPRLQTRRVDRPASPSSRPTLNLKRGMRKAPQK